MIVSNEFRKIRKHYNKLIKMINNHFFVGIINEWIIDNYYLLLEQKGTIKRFVKDKKLYIYTTKYFDMYKVFKDILDKYNYKINEKIIIKEVLDYQKRSGYNLKYKELSIIPLVIKTLLLKEVAIICDQESTKLKDKKEVKKIINELKVELLNNEIISLEDMIDLNKTSDYAIVYFNEQLKELGVHSNLIFKQFNCLLEKNNRVMLDVINDVHLKNTESNILINNIFLSLKETNLFVMENIYEQTNDVEKLLQEDDLYSSMTLETKTLIRQHLLKRARKEKVTADFLVKDIMDDYGNISKGIAKAKSRKPFKVYVYIGCILLLTIIFSYYLSSYLTSYRLVGFLVLLIPISELVIIVIQKIFLKFFRPQPLPKLNFSKGIPSNHKTMVVIPTIIKNEEKIREVFKSLEKYYLINRTKNLYFTLLGDTFENKEEEHENDSKIVSFGVSEVERLNQKYGKNIFNFIYRRRKYNEGEGTWLGFERKRGALLHFNDLLLGNMTESEQEEWFKVHTFHNFHHKIKYVITLDVDTELGIGSALKLVGTMAHPLNRPVLNEEKNKVIAGYGILQPRISLEVEASNKSLFSQIYAGVGGFDPYSSLYPNFYQDAFNEGTFYGKGIYDLEVYQQVLKNRFPNNLILSHDLVEGNYLHAGNVSDVDLVDGFPSKFLVDASRRSRWARGDMQIIGWLGNKVKNVNQEKENNPITLLGKWKIFDNIRRGLVYISLLLILLLSLNSNIIYPGWWLLFIILIYILPVIIQIIDNFAISRISFSSLKYYRLLVFGYRALILRAITELATIPYNAYLYLNSFIRSIYRMTISKKHLLNWVTADDAAKLVKTNMSNTFRQFWMNILVAALLILSAFLSNDYQVLKVVVAFIFILGPVITYFLSKDLILNKNKINSEDTEFLNDLAEKTWNFFKDNLTPENNYLIPDNYQENRDVKADVKTSPTNIGLSLVSIISAAELNFITNKEAIRLLKEVITTIRKLDKWHGHLYNWYNIETLEIMYPHFISSVDSGNLVASLVVAKGYLEKHNQNELVKMVKVLINKTDFSYLYTTTDVFSIGYHVDQGRIEPYNYNKFMSESRIMSYIAIAKGDVPSKHWLGLDKTLIAYKNKKGLSSWSGTFFEYYMPLLFMPSYANTILDEGYHFAYYAQVDYMRQVNPNYPWGISESAYNELDDAQNYKYKAFGIPQLRLREDTSERIVISPYSSALAIQLFPKEVIKNIKRFKPLNMFGEYGLYESYDFSDETPVMSYYAHHQAMILGSLTNFLTNGSIQSYFYSDIRNQAINMLIKEKVQLKPHINYETMKYKKYTYEKEPFANDIRVFNQMSKLPELSVLSNSRYSVIIDDRGNGYSKYDQIRLNRYRKVTERDYGQFVYIKDLQTNKVWSNTYAPMNIKPRKYEIVYALDNIKFVRADKDVITTTEIVVTKSHNAEIRKITLKNTSNKDKKLELTTYTEPILGLNDDDIGHPVFNNMFVYSEYDEKTDSIIMRRNLRNSNINYYMISRLLIKDPITEFEYETNRDNFIGRGRNTDNPIALHKKLGNFVGTTLDPIISLRNKIIIPKNSEKTVYLITGFGKSKEHVLNIVRTYSNKQVINEKGFETSIIMSNATNKMVNMSANDRRLYNTMLNYLLQTNYIVVSDEVVNNLTKNTLNQTSLWGMGISGDRPIILLDIADLSDLSLVKELLHAFEYYKSKAIFVDLVIINSENEEHAKVLAEEIENEKYHMYAINNFFNTPGSIFVIDRKTINEDQYTLLHTVARLKIKSSLHNSLQYYINELQKLNTVETKINEQEVPSLPIPYDKNKIKFFNEFGGFINNGRDYLIVEPNTPTAWSNVISNKNFGTVVTNNNCGFTYAHNSREYKLTSWTNDTLVNDYSEGFKINDKKINFSQVKFGFGYSEFIGNFKRIDLNLTQFVAKKDNVKFYKMTLKNNAARKQRIILKFWLNPNLGFSEEKTGRYLLSEFDDINNYLSIRNVYSQKFSDLYAYMSSTEKIENAVLNNLLFKEIEVDFYLNEKEEKEIAFTLGSATKEDLDLLVKKYQSIGKINQELLDVKNNWNDVLNVVQVKTPEDSFNYMVNGWTLYQTLASRLQARAGFYQVGGAFGFRDQLQDSMNVCSINPDITRKQILFNAAHQFKEGDVLHWWHPKLDIGLRSLYKDDYLWLIYAVCEYLKITEDFSILDEQVPFIKGLSLGPNEHEKLIDYSVSEESSSIYERCLLIIDKVMNELGTNGLPLMGGGDWNDGMNKIGAKGKGTSVWLGFFSHLLIEQFMVYAEKYDSKIDLKKYQDFNIKLRKSLRKVAWDGKYYLRAFFDNGRPVGSHLNDECAIDLLSQSFAILSGIADEKQIESMLDEVETKLVDRDLKIIKLLTPPFANSKDYPGYIMDYPKGIRENGGQYTHSVAWYIQALLKLGKNDLAFEHYQMVNPINRTKTKEDALKYKVEPYVFVADIYSNESFAGQGGWSWYTGTSGWFYKVALVEILGFNLRGNKLYITPNVPTTWTNYEITYQYKETVYEIKVELKNIADEIILDNQGVKTNYIELVNDKKKHYVIVKIGEKND
ncbi:MAG: glucoamylase family protein [Bacilli bacterium]|nr:glucoamylase family protein [Bacilli bacterium]